ncbi:hypothetical protein [Brevibacillus agri]|uniref:hypothetical protein n=1 Tax=Brevibacillus agri TaxID=51101 RepID=UPI0028682155|nr:hypothetical protein [Brevibacillus agri]
MKLFKRALPVFLLAISLVAPASAEKVGGYEYPVKPGTTEWKALESKMERQKVSQIPEDVLEQLSTEELVETVLDYPFLIDMYAYDSFEQGFSAVSSNFNGLKELLKREDAASKLLEKYKVTKESKGVKKASSDEMLDLKNLEIILEQSEIKEKLSPNEVEEVEELTEEPKRAAAAIYVKTPKGTKVEVLQLGERLSSAEIKALDREVERAYPRTTLLRSATTNYNCHSYAWYSTSSSNKYWMNDPGAYMIDGSYKKRSSASGDSKIYYDVRGNEHTGIVTTVYSGPPAPGKDQASMIKVKSKWGQLGLVEHMADDCPYYTSDSDLEFYK